jgi:hypothetical protein
VRRFQPPSGRPRRGARLLGDQADEVRGELRRTVIVATASRAGAPLPQSTRGKARSA